LELLLAACTKVGTCLALFACETNAFLTDAPTTRLVVDTNEDLDVIILSGYPKMDVFF
jgi:hypothetical protein